MMMNEWVWTHLGQANGPGWSCLLFVCLYDGNKGPFLVFLTPRLDGLEQADAGLKVGEQAFLRTDLPLGFLETNPSARVAAILAPAPPLPARAQHRQKKCWQVSEALLPLPGGVPVARASWEKNDKVGFNRCLRNGSNYTFIYIALYLQRTKYTFIHLKKKKVYRICFFWWQKSKHIQLDNLENTEE